MDSLLRRNATLLAPFWFCVVLLAAALIYAPGFAQTSNLQQVAIFASFVGIAALGQTMVVLGGGIDLSIPWLMALGGIQLAQWGGSSMPTALQLVILILIGAGVGLVNGIGVTVFRVSPIIFTLGVGGLVQAYLLHLGQGAGGTDEAPALVKDIVNATVAGFPVPLIAWLALAVLVGWTLKHTAFGRRLYAVGSGANVARLSGVSVVGTRTLTYVISGAASVAAGALLAGYVESSYIEMGEPYLFASIAAVTIGGASIAGGRGTYWGTVAGAVTLTLLNSLLPLLHLNDAGLKIVYGAVILLGVAAARVAEAISERE